MTRLTQNQLDELTEVYGYAPNHIEVEEGAAVLQATVFYDAAIRLFPSLLAEVRASRSSPSSPGLREAVEALAKEWEAHADSITASNSHGRSRRHIIRDHAAKLRALSSTGTHATAAPDPDEERERVEQIIREVICVLAFGDLPTCECGKDAVCVGWGEGRIETLAVMCDDCCGHGNEDGWCVPLEKFYPSKRRSARARENTGAPDADLDLDSVEYAPGETVVNLYDQARAKGREEGRREVADHFEARVKRERDNGTRSPWLDWIDNEVRHVRSLAAPTPAPALAPWYEADGSTVMLPAEEVERRRKLAAKVLDAARTLRRANEGCVFFPGLWALAEALDALAAPTPGIGDQDKEDGR
jgi:hypothetical protein